MPDLRSLPWRRLRSSSLLLAFANGSEFALPLVRGLVLAHILAPTQFGLAISITLVASTLEMISDLGVGQLATRSGSLDMLPSLHALTLARGFVLALVIAALGPVLARLFDAPGTAWVYSVMGAASFVRSFSHLEPRMRMHSYQYGPEALTTLGSHIAWTTASIAAAVWLRDYRAMTIGLFVYASCTTLITHWCSTTRYTLGWNQKIISEAIRFGRPLTANGIALAVVQMGDRFLVGARLGLEELAQYTALATAAFTPRSVVIKFAVTLFLPQFVNAADDGERRRLADAWVVFLASLGGVFGFCYMAMGRWLVAVAFGRHYLTDQTSVSLVAGLACIRFMATIPTAPSLANGRTSFVLLNTTLAASGVVLAAVLLVFDRSLHTVIGALILGESAGLVVVFDRLRRTIPMSGLVLWTAVLLTWGMILVVGILISALPDVGPIRFTLCCAGIIGEFVCAGALLRYSGSDLSSLLHMLLPQRRTTLRAVGAETSSGAV